MQTAILMQYLVYIHLQKILDVKIDGVIPADSDSLKEIDHRKVTILSQKSSSALQIIARKCECWQHCHMKTLQLAKEEH